MATTIMQRRKRVGLKIKSRASKCQAKDLPLKYNSSLNINYDISTQKHKILKFSLFRYENNSREV